MGALGVGGGEVGYVEQTNAPINVMPGVGTRGQEGGDFDQKQKFRVKL